MKLKKNIAISENGFLFNPLNGDSFSLNPIGTEIVTFLREEKSLSEIKRYILNKYDVDEATYEKDFTDFISQLKKYRFIENGE